MVPVAADADECAVQDEGRARRVARGVVVRVGEEDVVLVRNVAVKAVEPA